jgi:cytochrome c
VFRSLTFLSLALAAGLLAPAPARAQDAEAGKTVFKQICSICHDVVAGRNRVGPSLFGIVGRKTGEEPGFHYSAANKNANLTWDDATLDKYLAAPRQVVPGTIMAYAGLKDDKKRKDLIAYLATLK